MAAGYGNRRAREAEPQDGDGMVRLETPRRHARESRALGPVACEGAPLAARNSVAINKIEKSIFFFISTND